MSHIRMTLATTRRVLTQLAHDRRTVAMIFVVPCVLMLLLRWLFSENLATFDRIAPALLGVFPFVIMFIVTSVTTLRERTTGTLERLMALPIAKLDLILGYMGAFGLLAALQALLVSVLIVYGFNLDIAGPPWFLIVIASVDALLGTALGIFVSAFARTEFQAVQFMPAIIMPQVLIGGLFMPLEQMPGALEFVANFLPLTYAIDALSSVSSNVEISSDAWRDLIVIVVCMIAALLLAALTLPRKTK